MWQGQYAVACRSRLRAFLLFWDLAIAHVARQEGVEASCARASARSISSCSRGAAADLPRDLR